MIGPAVYLINPRFFPNMHNRYDDAGVLSYYFNSKKNKKQNNSTVRV